jgi:hypothetical protein
MFNEHFCYIRSWHLDFTSTVVVTHVVLPILLGMLLEDRKLTSTNKSYTRVLIFVNVCR